ncbi:MAG TPA: GNAT family N-acetyltransferase [Thermoanaerobaculia bacterium]|nr:GNAT family N-acetyltransferase [Thermoanaerobaculia bacterium]
MIEIRNLVGQSFETLTAAFNDAFSDYDIPANYPVEYLRQLVTRRGFRPDLAVGAFEGERLVGFVFNCLDGDDAYNSGTGVVISHRRQGIARQLMERSIETLPAKRYWLEVIETNHRAHALYRELGFEEPRRLQSWKYEGRASAPPDGLKPVLRELANVHLHDYEPFFEMHPSWQNTIRSIERAAEPFVAIGDERAIVVLFPSNGDVPLLAVHPAARRQGLGRALLDLAARRAAKPLRIMNIEDEAHGINAFLERISATRFVRQIEMVRAL